MIISVHVTSSMKPMPEDGDQLFPRDFGNPCHVKMKFTWDKVSYEAKQEIILHTKIKIRRLTS